MMMIAAAVMEALFSEEFSTISQCADSGFQQTTPALNAQAEQPNQPQVARNRKRYTVKKTGPTIQEL